MEDLLEYVKELFDRRVIAILPFCKDNLGMSSEEVRQLLHSEVDKIIDAGFIDDN